MSRLGSEGFEIASLKKRQTAVWDPMAHGSGTPWEDRATHGIVGAFLKTCLASMTGPRKLADQIRRPETTGDIRSFVIGCGLMWGLSAAEHVAWGLYHKAHSPPPPKFDLDEVSNLWVAIDLVVPLAGVTVGVVLLWMMYTAIYNRLVAQEANNVKLPEPLIGNVAGYAFGPSLLAPIPLVGPVLAAALMLFTFAAVGTSSRLRLRASAAVVDAVLGFVALVAVAGAGSAIPYFASDRFIPSGMPTIEKVVNEANEPAIRSSSDRR